MPTIQQSLELELELISTLLRRSRAQHGTASYHRKMTQLVSVVRKGQFLCIPKVVERMQYLASKLESDAYRTYHKNITNSQGVGSTNSNGTNAMAFPAEGIGEKWYNDPVITVSKSTSCSSLLLSAEDLLPNGTLCSHIRWLGTLHKQGTFQEVTQRMYTTMHSIFLETSRGFFLPLLSVAAASLARIHSIVMILARQSLLALLQVREQLQSIFQHICTATATTTSHEQLTIIIPQSMARYVSARDSANVVTWSHLHNLITTTCGWLSYDVHLPQFMDVTSTQYDQFVTTCSKTLDTHLYTKQKDTFQNTEEVSQLLHHNQGSYKRQERKNFKVEDETEEKVPLHDHNILKVHIDEEDIGDHVEFQSDQKTDDKFQVVEFSPSASSTQQAPFNIHLTALKAVDISQLEDANSIILSRLLPSKRKKDKDESVKKKKKKTCGECDENNPIRKRKGKASSSMSVIDEIFSFSTSKMKKK